MDSASPTPAPAFEVTDDLGSRPRILLAEGADDGSRAEVRRLLAERYEVEAVADGSAALAAARERLPDLLLGDGTPDGLGLVRALRAEERTQSVPVILLCGGSGEATRAEARAAGADDCLVRPFHSGELLARIEVRLELARVHREAVRRETALVRELAEADRRTEEFLVVLAHQLRDPLGPLRNAGQIVRLVPTRDANLRTAGEVIDRQVQYLARMVDDLLDVSRVTRGKVTLKTEPIDLAAVLTRAVETNWRLIEARRHQLRLELPPAPVRVLADPARLAQVFTALLDNAAKYTEEGGLIVVTAAREGAGAVVRVRDTGAGIPADMLSQVFELFTQAERSRGGLGIGLPLARGLVRLHGGTVVADSQGPGKGSTFTVRLPGLREEAAGGCGDFEFPTARAAHRILVVDDKKDAADSLAVLLRLTGHEVHTAYDGPTALEEARAFRPELMILDIGLPGLDGYEVARRVRQTPGLERVRLAALTGYGRPEDVARGRAAGFDHHLVKPADPQALRGLLGLLEETSA
jgi:signal transduction histidine kinase